MEAIPVMPPEERNYLNKAKSDRRKLCLRGLHPPRTTATQSRAHNRHNATSNGCDERNCGGMRQVIGVTKETGDMRRVIDVTKETVAVQCM